MIHYYDLTKLNLCVGILPNPGDTVVLCGAEVHREEETYRHSEPARAFAEKCDFHFWFGADEPGITLYGVPKAEFLGCDSRGGLFFRVEADDFLRYRDESGRCWRLGYSLGPELLSGGERWRETRIPCDDVEIFDTEELARRNYDIRGYDDLKKRFAGI